MAAVPKSIALSGITANTDIGTVPADKVWLIKSIRVAQDSSSTDTVKLLIAGDEISYATFSTSDQSIDLVPPSTGSGTELNNLIASDGEVVRIEPSGLPAKNVRMSYIEIDVA